MKKTLISVFILSLFTLSVYANGPKLTDYSAFIGKRIFETPLYEWMEWNDSKNAKEELQPEGPILFLKHYKNGYAMMFDINMVLNSISFYNKGGRYEKHLGVLPFNLKFGMNRDSLLRVVELRLDEKENNRFLLTRNYNNSKLELIFNGRGLNQINVVSADTIPLVNDLGFVRLVGNGKVISGDCDSVKGKMSFSNNEATYDGDWKNNMPHGKGQFKDKNNNVYKGEFKYGYFWGKGQMLVTGLYNYTGNFVMSRRQGKGLCSFVKPKGETYDGEWYNDMMSGLGKYSKGPQFYYYGNLLNNMFNGNGKIISSDGWLEGNFKDGTPNGFIKQYLKKENLYVEGQWIDGKREGKFKITDENKKVSYKLFQGDIEITDK